jgi:hypothetical protein
MFPIQAAVYATLNADPLLAGKVYDYVPDGTVFPYIRIGEAYDTPDNSLDKRGWSTVIAVHVWTQAHGNSEGMALGKRVTELLDLKPLAVEGFQHIATRYTTAQALVDPQPPGDIRHLVINFTVVTEE